MLGPRRLIVVVLGMSLFAMATRVAIDTDLWWHLAAGRWMVEHGRILTQDQFTHDFFGQPYFNPVWITDIVLYLLFRTFSYAGPSLLVSACVTFAYGFVYLACEGGPFLRAFCLVLAATASAVFWSPRPQIVSFLFAAVFVYVLHLFRWRGVNRLWVLPPLMALWANSHGGFAIGFILLALTLAGQAANALFTAKSGSGVRPGNTGWRGVRWLVGIGLACAAAVSVNPIGPRLLLYPFQVVSSGPLQDYVAEWQSPNFHQIEQQAFIWLLLAVFAAVAFARRRLNFTDFLLVSGTAYMALLAGRNIALFAIVAAPVLTRHADAAVAELRQRYPRLAVSRAAAPPRGAAVLGWVLLALAAMAAVLKVSIPLSPALNEAERAKVLPVQAAQHIEETRPPGPMFNSYNWGGFLEWELYGEYPVYIDGRTDLYPDDYLLGYLDTVFVRPGWQARLDREGIRLVVMETNTLLAQQLRDEPGWTLAYEDRVAAVFTRDGP